MFRLGIAKALIQDNCSLSPNAEVVAGAVLRPPDLRLKCHLSVTYTRDGPTLNIPLQIFKQRNVHSANHFARMRPGLVEIQFMNLLPDPNRGPVNKVPYGLAVDQYTFWVVIFGHGDTPIRPGAAGR